MIYRLATYTVRSGREPYTFHLSREDAIKVLTEKVDSGKYEYEDFIIQDYKIPRTPTQLMHLLNLLCAHHHMK
jgi:hypothetical protein